jgi:hypothetical protein
MIVALMANTYSEQYPAAGPESLSLMDLAITRIFFWRGKDEF